MNRRWQAMGWNLIAPGLGQFRLRRWLRGSLFLGATLAGFAWATWETLAPLVQNIQNLLADSPSNDALRTLRLGQVALGLVGGMVVWALSFLDLLVFPPKNDPRPGAEDWASRRKAEVLGCGTGQESLVFGPNGTQLETTNHLASRAMLLARRGGLCMQGTKLIGRREKTAGSRAGLEWKTVASHTHMIRTRRIGFDDAKQLLVDWCARLQVDAVGVGSPWEPVSAASYGLHEGAERDRYYAGLVAPGSVMDEAAIQALFDDLNRLGGGRTLFYQDNETPKGRHGHLWYFGFAYVVPAWHDYSQDRPVRYYENAPETDLNKITGQPHVRRSYFAVVSEQRRHGAVAVWAHPTSWWRQGGAFVTNIASDAPLHLFADGRIDGVVVQGYDAFHRSYQEFWFSLLDTGAIVPGFAETDHAFDVPALRDEAVTYTNRMHIPGPLTLESICAAARTGRVFASSGAFITIAVDGVPMGGVTETRAGQAHRVVVTAEPVPGEETLGRLELIGRGGTVLAQLEGWVGGELEFEVPGADEPGWLVARVFGQHDDPEEPDQKKIKHLAITNPVYLHPQGFKFEQVQTVCHVVIREDSPWKGGTLAFVLEDDSVADTHAVEPGAWAVTVPANARIRLQRGEETQEFYVAMENREVQRLLRYLHDGEFLDDYPDAVSGDVPSAAFRLDDMRKALSNVHLAL
jgi:hypothetical protein